jgi:hypothetical protein
MGEGFPQQPLRCDPLAVEASTRWSHRMEHHRPAQHLGHGRSAGGNAVRGRHNRAGIAQRKTHFAHQFTVVSCAKSAHVFAGFWVGCQCSRNRKILDGRTRALLHTLTRAATFSFARLRASPVRLRSLAESSATLAEICGEIRATCGSVAHDESPLHSIFRPLVWHVSGHRRRNSF